jgi:hypothetical protein
VTALLLPLGHYLGPVHSPTGPAEHLVRVGWRTWRLPEGLRADTWALAHGGADPLEGPWRRAGLLTAAAATGLGDVTADLDALVSDGLVAEVRSGPEAEAFAARVRLQPLLVGLGNSADDPLDALGIPGLPAAARVRPRVAEVWRWAGAWPSLAAARDGFARIAARTGTDPAGTAADLDWLLVAVQQLVAVSAGHLDAAGGGRLARRHDLPPLG